MTFAIVAGVIVLLGIVLGVKHQQKAEAAESLKPAPQMTFPVTPSEGDRYASSNGSWVFTVKGWELG
jgi:hypothetical protein